MEENRIDLNKMNLDETRKENKREKNGKKER